jgi:hypothetical protein
MAQVSGQSCGQAAWTVRDAAAFMARISHGLGLGRRRGVGGSRAGGAGVSRIEHCTALRQNISRRGGLSDRRHTLAVRAGVICRH